MSVIVDHSKYADLLETITNMNLAFLGMAFGALALSEHGEDRTLVMPLVGLTSASSALMGVVVGTLARVVAAPKH